MERGLHSRHILNTVNELLGLLYTEQGRLSHAEEMHERALAGKEEAF